MNILGYYVLGLISVAMCIISIKRYYIVLNKGFGEMLNGGKAAKKSDEQTGCKQQLFQIIQTTFVRDQTERLYLNCQ